MANLRSFFEPKSVALIGATDKEGTIGRTLLENLLLGKDKRAIYPVSPDKGTLLGIQCYPNIGSLSEPPELVVIAAPAATVPDIAEEGGRAGVKAMIVASAGFGEMGGEGQARAARLTDTARQHGIRMIGPNCLGVIRPAAGLNASFAARMPRPGRIAFLSQSRALGSAILEWAVSRDIGFSAFVSLGAMLDVDLGDLIDYFGADPATNSILINMEFLGESLRNARKFMSSARGFARTKPIVVIKSGKFRESVKALRSHADALLSEDLYYDAAFDRVGAVRVEEIEDLFNCASILNLAQLPRGPNLAIVTNAGGPAVLATDALISRGGRLAQFSEQTLAALDKLLPPYWSRSNPLNTLGEVGPETYVKAVQLVLEDPGVDGILVMYTPQGAAAPVEIAQAIVNYEGKHNKPLVAAMMGDEVGGARQLLRQYNIPVYEFPEEAVKTYLYMYKYARNLGELYQTPEDLPLELGTPKNYLRILCRKALKNNVTLLSEIDSEEFLSAYGIPSAAPYTAKEPDDAVAVASRIGYPIAMKVASPDIENKYDAGAAMLNIFSASQVRKAFAEIMRTVKQRHPDARIDGVSIQRMVTNYDYELIIGSKKDPVFGPVIIFGPGGPEAEFFKDIAVGLPPLNRVLARRIIERTRSYTLLSQGFRAKPPANLRLLEETLVRVSNLIIDFPEIKELSINPLLVKGDTVTALDARIILDETMAPQKETGDYGHLIISPYPTRYIQPWRCRDGRSVILRPIRPEDEPLERELLASLSPESSRFRFFYILKEISHDMLSRFCNIDYDREMAVIAEYNSDSKRRNVGVGRLIIEPAAETAEFAVLVADDFHNNGLGLKLTDVLIGIAQEKGVKSIYGIVLNDNVRMLGLARKLGFTMERLSDDESKITLEL